MVKTVSVEGRITVDNSNEMRRKLCDALRSKPSRLTVDLSKATYIDTSGLATLVEAVRTARQQSTQLLLAGLNGQPRSLFEVAELNRLFEFASEEATP